MKVLLLFNQMELDEDTILPKYNGIGVGQSDVPWGEYMAMPN